MNESKTFIYVSVSTVQVKHGRAQEANSIRQPFTRTLCVVKLGSQQRWKSMHELAHVGSCVYEAFQCCLG